MSAPGQVVCLRGDDDTPVWRIYIGGQLHGACWPDRGSAKAGLAVEQRRRRENAMVSYAHEDAPDGARFCQRMADPLPPWAVGVRLEGGEAQ
jgi:hypothetical protein